jgi:hypothetical protein
MPEWKTTELFITGKYPNILKQITRITKGNCLNTVLREKYSRYKILKIQIFHALFTEKEFSDLAPLQCYQTALQNIELVQR